MILVKEEKDQFIECRRWRVDILIANGKVCKGRGILGAVVLTPSAGGAATATIRDGTDETGTKLLVIGSIASHSQLYVLQQPIYFDRGLYLSGTANITAVNFQYKLECP